MRSLILRSPAKLNLFLKIIRRRPNGYHELVTLFHRISLFDTLRLKKIPSGFKLTCSRPDLSCGEDNLITRAYRELQKIYPKLGGVSVHLTKKIPMGGGLGGGSGNAGTFLLGMKKLYNLSISRDQLVKIGAKLGADVAFFIYDTPTAMGKGVGEKIRPLQSKARHYFVLVMDPQGLNTKKVYETLSQLMGPGPIINRARPHLEKGASLTKASRVATILSDFLGRKKYRQASQLLANDLEAPAFKLRPSIEQLILKIKQRDALSVQMSGSGPTVFALVPNLAQAKKLAAQIRREEAGKQVVICHSY